MNSCLSCKKAMECPKKEVMMQKKMEVEAYDFLEVRCKEHEFIFYDHEGISSPGFYFTVKPGDIIES